MAMIQRAAQMLRDKLQPPNYDDSLSVNDHGHVTAKPVSTSGPSTGAPSPAPVAFSPASWFNSPRPVLQPPAATPSPAQTAGMGFGFKPSTVAPAPQPPAAAPAPMRAAGGLSLLDAATTWNPTTGTVSDDETVARQLERLLSANSAYVDQARQRAIQMANERGLQNTTLAASAGEEAAIAQALPIAQHDAQSFFTRASQNLDAQNAAGQFMAQQGMTARQLAEQARQFDNTALLDRAKLAEQARQFDNTALLDRAKLAEQQRQFDAEVASRERLAQLDADTKAYLANIEAQYKTLMQSSASAADLWKQYQDAVARIMLDKDMDQANKQAAIDRLGADLKDGMAVIGAISALDLGSLMNFESRPLTPPQQPQRRRLQMTAGRWMTAAP